MRESFAALPAFRAAYVAGSTNWLSDDDQLPLTSDLDVMVIVSEPNLRNFRRKFIYRHVLLEASYVEEKQFHSCDQILSDYHLAPSLAATNTIFDPKNFLTQRLDVIRKEFARVDWVLRRMGDARQKALHSLRSIRPNAPLYEQAMACLFAAGITVHVLLTAGLRNPTVRARFRSVKELLYQYGRQQMHCELLRLLGAESISAHRARQHWTNVANAFDIAKAVVRTSFPFASDITELARPLSIDSNREWIEHGFHREAMFWLAVTSCRCRQIMETDAPESLTPDFLAGQAQLLADLGLNSPAGIQRRSAEIERMLPVVCSTAENIVAANKATIS